MGLCGNLAQSFITNGLWLVGNVNKFMEKWFKSGLSLAAFNGSSIGLMVTLTDLEQWKID